MVDKNLFLYDLAIVTIMKNEGPYVKEWLDYHLLAGAEHFYFYDNESTDDTKAILQPYIDNGAVTYIFYPGTSKQLEVYNDALRKFKFECRYMSFVDADEFLRPKSLRSITNVVDGFMSAHPNSGGVEVKWVLFGSGGQVQADFSRGVLDRFTRCGDLSNSIKSISNPRRVSNIVTPHFMLYFDSVFAMSDVSVKWFPAIKTSVSDEIVMNHYHTKSREEYDMKRQRGDVLANKDEKYTDGLFNALDRNENFDDGIIKYREARRDAVQQQGGGGIQCLNKAVEYDRLFTALIRNLSQTFGKVIVPQIFVGKMETFLTCLNLSAYLRNTLLDEVVGRFFEEMSLKAIHKTFATPMQLYEVELLIRELPNILPLQYPVVKDIRVACITAIQNIKAVVRERVIDQSMEKLLLWKDINEWDYLERLLKGV